MPAMKPLWPLQVRADGKAGGLRQFGKASLACAIYGTGLLHLMDRTTLRLRGPQVIILNYHRIVHDFDASREVTWRPLLTSARTFEKQLRWIAERYDVISLDRAIEALRGDRPLRRDAAVITIDDGYRDIYSAAFPIIRDLKCPVTVYVPSALIGSEEPIIDDSLFVLLREALCARHILFEVTTEAGTVLPGAFSSAWHRDDVHSARMALVERLRYPSLGRLRDALARRLPGALDRLASLRLMTWPMVREMQRAGVSIGSHSRTHARLPLQPPSVVWDEVSGSKAELEAQLRAPVLDFAYPGGQLSPAVESAVRRAGYRSASGTADQPNRVGCNLYALGRQFFGEHSSELWPAGRHGRAMVLAQVSGILGRIRLGRQLAVERLRSTRESDQTGPRPGSGGFQAGVE